MTSCEQRENIKFCVFLQKTPSETLELIVQAYGEDAMKKSQVYEWHKRFCEGERFANANVIKENVINQLKDLAQNDFERCFEQLYERWGKCMLEKLIGKNYFLNQSAKEAFKAYVRAYDSHHLKLIFDVATLDLAKVAKSFGFTVPPAVDLQVLNSKNSRPRKRSGGGGFGFFKNMNKDGKSKPNVKYLQPNR